MSKDEVKFQEDYKYGFKDEDTSIVNTGIGLTEEVVRQISKLKNEPEWMLEFRLKAFKAFQEMPMPSFGPDLSMLNFDSYTYFTRMANGEVKNWEDVPETVKNTFQKLGIPEAEQKYLAGVSTQYESEVVYHNMLKEVEEKGVIFLSTDMGLKLYPEIFKKYFGTVVPIRDNKFSALNGACWSGGSFVYVPKGVHLEKPLQSYFRINNEKTGQFERTLIIVDEGADVHYVEGCTAPSYSKESLHSGVVEIIVLKNAKCRYSTVQNWSTNIVNLVTQRAICYEGASMDWIDGNVGSGTNMKYPAVILAGEGAKGTCISIAVAGKGQYQDAGSRMIHLASNTSSTIISKSIVKGGGTANYRGTVRHMKNAKNCRSHVECDTFAADVGAAEPHGRSLDGSFRQVPLHRRRQHGDFLRIHLACPADSGGQEGSLARYLRRVSSHIKTYNEKVSDCTSPSPDGGPVVRAGVLERKNSVFR